MSHNLDSNFTCTGDASAKTIFPSGSWLWLWGSEPKDGARLTSMMPRQMALSSI